MLFKVRGGKSKHKRTDTTVGKILVEIPLLTLS